MIIVRRKSIDDIKNMTNHNSNILILGCDGCSGIIQEGGKRQADLMAMSLEMKKELDNESSLGIQTSTILRQCDKNIILAATRAIQESINNCDVIISLGCGVGVQTLAEVFPKKTIIPGTDTLFMGEHHRELGTHVERCRGCGDCMLYETGGICPIARCAKGLLNGPCGGVISGKCEVGNYTKDCAWYLMWKRLKEMGQIERFTTFRAPRKFSQSMGAPREFKQAELEKV